MKTQKGSFIPLPKDFSVSVPGDMVPENKFFQMHPTGLYITHSFDRAWIQYAGDDAEKSHAVLEIPFDPTFLRKLGRELNKLAKTIEGERG